MLVISHKHPQPLGFFLVHTPCIHMASDRSERQLMEFFRSEGGYPSSVELCTVCYLIGHVYARVYV